MANGARLRRLRRRSCVRPMMEGQTGSRIFFWLSRLNERENTVQIKSSIFSASFTGRVAFAAQLVSVRCLVMEPEQRGWAQGAKITRSNAAVRHNSSNVLKSASW